MTQHWMLIPVATAKPRDWLEHSMKRNIVKTKNVSDLQKNKSAISVSKLNARKKKGKRPRMKYTEQ